jgi:hypothetical protein
MLICMHISLCGYVFDSGLPPDNREVNDDDTCHRLQDACRLQFALSTCMRQQIHAETLVSTLLDHYKLSAELIPFYFFRVRQNGLLETRDFKPRWKSFEIPKCDLPMFEPFEEREKQLLEQAAADGDSQA